MTGRRLEAVLNPATDRRPASLGIDVEGFDYDRSQHSNGTTLLVKGVTAADLRSLAVKLLDLAESMPKCPAPVLIGEGSWSYRGWSFHQRRDRNFVEYAIHGPGSNGKRARKVVFHLSEAVDYIDQRAN